VIASTNEEGAAGKGRCGHTHFIHDVVGQFFVFRTGLDDEHIAVFGNQIDLAIGSHRRGRETNAATNPLLIMTFARFGIETIEDPVIAQVFCLG